MPGRTPAAARGLIALLLACAFALALAQEKPHAHEGHDHHKPKSPGPVIPKQLKPILTYFDNVMSSLCISTPPLICHLSSTVNSTVHGHVTFEPVFHAHDCATRINATVHGLTHGAKQAIHIHNYGDVGLSNAKGTGGHFAGPGGMKADHGLPGSKKRHWGDFGSLVANMNGTAEYSRVDRMITIPGIVGRGMVVHAGEDKGAESQPSGGAGARMAQCVIGYANPDLL